jgi:hypothetical protein
VDRQDFEAVEAYGVERWLGELALALRQETYRPDPIRRVYIPKSSECATLPAARGFAVETPLRRRYPTTEPNSPMRGRHGHSDSERNKRGDDHSDSNCPESTTEPAFGFFRMGDRDILDQESDHIGAGIQHHADSKAHKAALKVA